LRSIRVLDVPYLVDLIRRADAVAENIDNQDIVLLLGPTGAGEFMKIMSY
jgi:hypothetical protein